MLAYVQELSLKWLLYYSIGTSLQVMHSWNCISHLISATKARILSTVYC